MTRFEISAGGLRGGRGGPRIAPRIGLPIPLDPSSLPSSIAVHRSRRELERSLARDLTRMRAFYRISLLASAEAVPEEIGARILNEFTRTLEFSRAEIWLLGKDRRLRRLSWHGRVPARVDPQGMPLRRCAFGRVLMRRRQGLRFADAGGGPGRRRCHLGWEGLTTLFGAALRDRYGPIG
ncbi:MAG TPA: hypothetical protein VEO94_04730, partial [Candidatus Dormibacteraeota bacterium]|nr:hypothetical protein [Candidatus Dormibacteraeota bacterium]